MTVLFYISGHGFGHASRQVEIITAFAKIRPDVRLVVRSAVNPGLLRRTLAVPFALRPGACDTGIVQRTSVEHDDPATVRETVAFYSTFRERIAAEVAALSTENVDLIVADIPPLAFEVAARLGVPAVAIGNFTWDWIYETHAGMAEAAPELVPTIRAAYQHAALGLELPFSGGFEIFPAVERLPLVSRRPTREPRDTRAHFGLAQDRPAALLSFGGYGMPALDVTRIDARDWTLVLTDRILPMDPADVPAHIVYVPEHKFQESGFRYEDLIAAVDVVVSKPGYGIVSECMTCDKPLLYTSRGVFREYDVFVRDMPRYLRCRFIGHDDLFAGRWRDGLEGVRLLPAPAERIDANGADVAAEALAQVLRA